MPYLQLFFFQNIRIIDWATFTVTFFLKTFQTQRKTFKNVESLSFLILSCFELESLFFVDTT